MTPQRLQELLDFGREQRGVEFKGPGSFTDAPLIGKVIRAMLAMANTADGGLVIVGVAEKDDGTPNHVGLSPAQLRTWNRDALGDKVAVYADPSLDFETENTTLNEKTVFVIMVRPFHEVPVICKKEMDVPTANGGTSKVLRKGACYFRPRRKPESAEVSSAEEMRELLTRAIDLGIKAFVARAHHVGMLPAQVEGTGDEERFDAQLGDLK